MRTCLVVVGVSLAALTCGAMALADQRAQDSQHATGVTQSDEQPVKASLIAEHASIQPGGKTRVGILFEIEAGWHIYAQDPGEAGLATRVVWSGPGVVSFGPLIWPQAQEFHDPGNIRTFGYTHTLVLSSVLNANVIRPGVWNGPYPSPLTISAHVEWLACKDVCVPGHADLTTVLPVSPKPPKLSADARLFEHVSDNRASQ